MRRVRVRSLAAGMAVGVCVLTVGAAGASTVAAPKSTPTTRELNRVLDRTVGSAALERAGVFVTSGSIEGEGSRRCAAVELLNPSAANITYLRSLYGRSICPSRKPSRGYAQTAMACTTDPPPPDAPATVVPDLIGLQPYRAARRLRAAGFAFSGCATTTKRPTRYSYEHVLQIVRQCPAAGATVPQGTAVGFTSRGILPGGFTVYGGATGGC